MQRIAIPLKALLVAVAFLLLACEDGSTSAAGRSMQQLDQFDASDAGTITVESHNQGVNSATASIAVVPGGCPKS